MANPYILKGIGQGFQQATDTLLRVSLRKQQLEKDDKKFSLDMKIKKLNLETLQEKMSPEQLEYNKTLQGLEMKQHKIKTEAATLELDKARRGAELSQSVLDSYLKGAVQGEAGMGQGFEIGGQQYNLDLGAVTGLPLKQKSISYNERYDQDVRLAESGKISWEELNRKYPREREETEDFRLESIPLEKNPKFKEGWGLEAMTSENVAKLEPITKRAIALLKTEKDLKDLLDNRKKFEDIGVDIKAVLEYFGRDELGAKR